MIAAAATAPLVAVADLADHDAMKALLPLLLLAAAPVPVDHPRTYLASVVGVPLRAGESMESFSFSTWGVEFKAVCRIPGGWRIKAGNSATPDGVLEGEGSQGATWFNRADPPELVGVVLLTLYDRVQRQDIANGPDATFKGHAIIDADAGEKKVALTYKNIRLIAARRCP